MDYTEEEEKSVMGKAEELITWGKVSEDPCLEFSDAFLEAGYCSLATWSKCFVFCLSFFWNLAVGTVSLVVCCFLFHDNADASSLLCSYFYHLLHFTLMLCYCNLH